MPPKQKQKQSQNVKVIVNLAEQKRKKRRAKRTIKKIVQEQSRIQPSINVSSYYHPQQQAPTIPRYINPIHAPITEASIQELRRVFLENMGQQPPSAEMPNIPKQQTPIETPEPTPTSSVEEPIITPMEAPRETPMVEEDKTKRPRRTKAEKEEAIGMGFEDPNPLLRNKAERSALKRMQEQLAIQQGNIAGNITSPLGQRVADIFRKQFKGKG